MRAVWGRWVLGGCAGGVRGCATAVCRETRAEHDAAAINTGPHPAWLLPNENALVPCEGQHEGGSLPGALPLSRSPFSCVPYECKRACLINQHLSVLSLRLSDLRAIVLLSFFTLHPPNYALRCRLTIVVWLFPLLQASYRQVNQWTMRTRAQVVLKRVRRRRLRSPSALNVTTC